MPQSSLDCTRTRPTRRAEEETSAREAVLAESEEVLAQMEVQHRELLAALKSATDEAVAARKALAAAQEEGRRRDGLVLKNQQLESARHFDRVAQVGCWCLLAPLAVPACRGDGAGSQKGGTCEGVCGMHERPVGHLGVALHRLAASNHHSSCVLPMEWMPIWQGRSRGSLCESRTTHHA